ncbi:MAG: hypothetical protein QF763_08055, partial [Candidatus Marinimicrobia bacterium]|nr:hypothetical protein [Candidatus Neomarinimicrobiota bacterium]
DVGASFIPTNLSQSYATNSTFTLHMCQVSSSGFTSRMVQTMFSPCCKRREMEIVSSIDTQKFQNNGIPQKMGI